MSRLNTSSDGSDLPATRSTPETSKTPRHAGSFNKGQSQLMSDDSEQSVFRPVFDAGLFRLVSAPPPTAAEHRAVLLQLARVTHERDDAVKAKLSLSSDIKAYRHLIKLMAISEFCKLFRIRKRLLSATSSLQTVTGFLARVHAFKTGSELDPLHNRYDSQTEINHAALVESASSARDDEQAKAS